jgi:hypothetical protein
MLIFISKIQSFIIGSLGFYLTGGILFNYFSGLLFNYIIQHLASLRDWLLPMLMNGQVGFKEDAKKQTPIINLAQQDQRFELWLSSQGLAARGEIDKTTLREIFNLMDEEEHGK